MRKNGGRESLRRPPPSQYPLIHRRFGVSYFVQTQQRRWLKIISLDCTKERVMGLPIDRLASGLPRRFPVGAKYVVEGSRGEVENMRVIARYVLLPDGRRINV